MGDLIGRREEVASVLRALDAAGTVHVFGGAGFGKSRLLSEVTERLTASSWRVESIAGTHAGRGIPFGAVAAHLPSDPPASQAVLLGHLLRTLVEGEATRVAMVVDDAHLLDDLTLVLLHDLVRRPDVAVVMSTRDGEDVPPTLDDLLAGTDLLPMSVGPLDDESIAAMACAIVGGPLDTNAAESLVAATRGSPLLLRELIADALDTGHLVARSGTWTLTGDLVVGGRVTELIRARVRRLDPALRRVLDRVAVAEPASLDLFADDADALSALEQRRLIALRPSRAGLMVETDHPLIGEALRHAMTISDRAVALRSLCAAAEGSGLELPGSAARAVAWYRELGGTVPPSVATLAAWEALMSLELDTAASLATLAAAHDWRAAFVLGEVARVDNDGVAAVDWLARAVELADDDTAIRKIAMAKAGVHAFQLTNPKAAIATLKEAAGRVIDPRNSVELLCEAAFHATLLGEFDEVVATSREVLARPDLDLLTIWTAAVNLGYAQTILGDVTDLEASLMRARDAVRVVRRDHPSGSDLTAALSIASAILDARIPDACALASESVGDLAIQDAHRGLSSAVASEALLMAGRPDAVAYARQGVDQLRVYDPYNSLPYGLGFAALLAIMGGDRVAAEGYLAEVDQDSVDIRSRAVLGRASAALVALDDPAVGAQHAAEAGSVAVGALHLTMGAMGLVDSLGYAPVSDVGSHLAQIALPSTSPLLHELGRLGAAVVGADVDALLAIAGRLRGFGAHHLAAVALVISAGVDHDLVRARRNLARADAAALAAGVVAPLWSPPPLDDALSRREIEVVALAATGSTDQEIADRLFLARRTVGNHLHRCYAKLEVSGRGDLAGLFS